MAEVTHVHVDGACVNICGGGAMKVVREKDAGTKWCFRCRKHLPHKFVVLDYEEPSYWDPIAQYQCSGCGGDYTAFPGTLW